MTPTAGPDPADLATVDRRTARELRGLARVLVRSGYADRAAVTAALTEAVQEDAPSADAGTLVPELIGEAQSDLAEDASTWPTETGPDRLDAVLAELESRGLVVVRYTSDHHAARQALEAAADAKGLVFFTDTDVWHAVDFGMLELKIWHPDSANVAPGEPLLEDVLALLNDHDLPAVFDEGRIEVTITWQRRSAL
ncbi:hypothetical protein EV643_107139 [Kribbella sp. VKM Ac-2527]|uniref:DUF6891 domain-containing protein n=1 Tax=Kribbella caucasensis TaxID=2512215 RepID=A0A4R6KFB1_9ACTN|nr:hypothetical protein [Kribbella sp. VKM Ac-2527]TDO48510.1 hypothetical protein EV643_107139 [Kribbella sp. VKM Ac-2527]